MAKRQREVKQLTHDVSKLARDAVKQLHDQEREKELAKDQRLQSVVETTLRKALAEVEAKHQAQLAQQVDLVRMTQLTQQFRKETDPAIKAEVGKELTLLRLRAAELIG